LSCIPTMIAAKEQRYLPKEGSINTPGESRRISISGVFIKIFKGFIGMPNKMARVALLYFLSWCAYSPFMIYITNYFGSNVYGGNAQSTNPDLVALYEKGVKMGMYGLAIFAACQWVYSLILPFIVRKINVKATYFFSQLIATACYILFLFFNTPAIGLILMSALSINFTTFNSVPFALVASVASKDDAGLYMGVLNSAAVVAQTVTNSIAGLIISREDENVAWAIAFGGCISLIACVLVFILPNITKTKEEEPLLSSD